MRPAGAQPKDCAIVKAAFRAAELLGIEPEYRYESSTDANIPISMGIPAITVGRGGEEDGIGKKYDKSEAQGAMRLLLQSDVVVIPKSTHK